MYTVTVVTDGVEYQLHNPKVQKYKLIGPKLTMEVNRTGTLEFQIPFDHPNLSKIRQMQSEIFVYEDGDILWAGRMLTKDEDLHLTGTAVCEGVLGYLLDSQVGEYVHEAGVRSFLQFLIVNHNGRTNEKKHFLLGDVTVEDDNDYIDRSQERWNYMDTLSTINEKLVDKLGGFLSVRYRNGNRYIDYLDTAPANRQAITFGENLINIAKTVPSSDLITALIPIGADYEVTTGSGENETTETRKVDITSYQATTYHPAGADYIFLPEAVAKFGYIYGVKTWEDVTLQTNLYSKALKELRKVSDLYATLEIQAVDLSAIDSSLSSFRVGESVPVKSGPHDVDKTYMVTKIEYDLADPGNSRLSLDGTVSTYTRSESEIKRKQVAEGKARENRIRELNDEIKTNREQVEAEILKAKQEATEQFAEDLADLEEELQGDLSELQTAINGQLAQMRTAFEGDISDLEEELQGDLSDLRDAITAQIGESTALITGQEGGNVVVDTDANGKPYQILIMDTNDKQTATNVIRLNNAGLGFSTSGYAGPYSNAWTIDGRLIASFITAVGTVTAGSIGGWTIGQNTISKQIDSTHSMTISAANGIMFQSGQNVLRINQNGIAFSSDGGTTWTTGWGVDGSFVASFITAVGTVTAGSIGGWTIGQNTISKTIDATHEIVISPTQGLSFRSGNFWIRISPAGLAFSTDNGTTWKNAWTVDGNLVADFVTACQITTGKIGGWNIGPTMLWNGTAGSDDYISLSSQSGIQLGVDAFVFDKQTGELLINASEIKLHSTDSANSVIDFEIIKALDGGNPGYERRMKTAMSLAGFEITNALTLNQGTVIDEIMQTVIGEEGVIVADYDYGGSGQGTSMALGPMGFDVTNSQDVQVVAYKTTGMTGWKHRTSDAFELSTSRLQCAAVLAQQAASGTALVINSNGEIRRTSSSRRYKKNIRDAKIDPDVLYGLPVREFKYKKDCIESGDEREETFIIGLVAEEVEEVVPIAAVHNADGETEDWDVRVLLPLMLKLVQEQGEQIKSITAQLEEIERKVNQ